MMKDILEMDIEELEVLLYNIARAWCNDRACGEPEDWTPYRIFEEIQVRRSPDNELAQD